MRDCAMLTPASVHFRGIFSSMSVQPCDRICSKCSVFKLASEFRKHRWCRECANANQRQWYRENKERAKKAHENFILANPDYYLSERYKKSQQKSGKRYYDENVEYYREKHRAYYRNNKDKYKAANHRRRSRKNQNGGTFSWEDFIEVCAKYGNICLRCLKLGTHLTPDHVIPLALGGKNSIDNIQPLCRTCNISKGTKVTDYRTE